jgi:hypothetical protein
LIQRKLRRPPRPEAAAKEHASMYTLLRRLSTARLPIWLVGERDVLDAHALRGLGLIETSPLHASSCWRQFTSVHVAAITPAGWAVAAACADDIDPDSASGRYAEQRDFAAAEPIMRCRLSCVRPDQRPRTTNPDHRGPCSYAA